MLLIIKELVAEQPDSTLAELQVRLAKEKVKVSQSGISRFLHHINLKSLHAAKQDRPDVAAARKALRREQLTLDPKLDADAGAGGNAERSVQAWSAGLAPARVRQSPARMKAALARDTGSLSQLEHPDGCSCSAGR